MKSIVNDLDKKLCWLISYKWLDRFTQLNLYWKVLIKLFLIIYSIFQSNRYSQRYQYIDVVI